MKIGVVDSGIGGITTLSALINQVGADYIYVADHAFAPYGNKPSHMVRHRLVEIVEYLIGMGVQAVVIACNTATAVGVEYLRERVSIPVIGTEPAIMPALRACNGSIAVLTTPLTAATERFRRLISMAPDRLQVVTMPTLASQIEMGLDDLTEISQAVARRLQPYAFCGVVLGCTHYVYLRPYLNEIYRDNVFDGNLGIARRLRAIVGSGNTYSTIELVKTNSPIT